MLSSRVQCCKRQKAGASSETTGNMIGQGLHCKELGLSRCHCKETTARRSPVGKEISGYICSS